MSRAAVAVEPTTAAARTATSQRCGVHTGAGVCAANNGPEWAAGEPQGRLKYNYKPNWRPSPKQLRSEVCAAPRWRRAVAVLRLVMTVTLASPARVLRLAACTRRP